MTTEYWIAQHVPDLFRNEARNVGVIVKSNEKKEARFFGEIEPGEIDGRILRGLAYPGVYRQWVQFWRAELSENTMESLVAANGSHYRIVQGGEVTDIGDDIPKDIVNYLYGLVVSEGGLAEALGVEDEAAERAALPFVEEIAGRLFRMGILATEPSLIVPHPVQRNQNVLGDSMANHAPEFVQENGRISVIETVDFTSRFKHRARDHAGWSAYMFKDIRAVRKNTEAIALVRAQEDDLEYEEVTNGLAMLRSEAEVIDWLKPDEQQKFLDERKKLSGT